ncbi:hypothetical protein ACP4OV_009119 [Aristida adscensionis]
MGAWSSKGTPARSSPPPGWPDLPPELADLVLRRLPSIADRLRFAAVCRRWLHVATRYAPPGSRPRLPWLSFLDGHFRSLPDGELHSFRFKRYTLCLGSFGSWLLLREAGRAPGRTRFLKNPLTGATLRLPGRLSLDASHDTGSTTDFLITKVIVCPGGLVAAKVNYRCGPDMVVCCRPRASPPPSSWPAGLCNGYWYADMGLYKGKLYTVTTEGALFAHEVAEDDDDAGKPRVSRIEQVIPAPHLSKLDGYHATLPCARTCYLVTSPTGGELLMVRWIIPHDRYTSEDTTRQMTFKVFQADLEMSRWLELERLEDQVLFVSPNCSKAVSACNYQQGNNKIYFLDEGIVSWFFGPASNPRTCGVYDMNSKTIHSISLGEVRISDQKRASWFFP